MPRKITPTPASPNTKQPFDDVSPLWLLRAIALTLGAIALLFYLTYAALFYFGQWQLVLHPSRTLAATPAKFSLPFESIRFGPDASGQPQLSGWWIPAARPSNSAPNSRYQNFTLLYLHGADGSLADTLPNLADLHALGINLFAIDYRGYGASVDLHPTESRLTQDTAAAFDYLTNTRHLLPTQIIPIGDGIGATLAARLAAQHHAVPALILRNPPPDPRVGLLTTAQHDPRSRLIPTTLLFNQRFEIASTLTDLKTPKLLIDDLPDTAPTQSATAKLYQSAAAPKTSLYLQHNWGPADTSLQKELQRFFDDYLPIPPGILTPLQ